MLKTLLADSYEKGLLWVGGHFDQLQSTLNTMFQTVHHVKSSFDALRHIEQCRLGKLPYPLVVIEQGVSAVDRDCLIRVLKKVPDLQQITVLALGSQTFDPTLGYTANIKNTSELISGVNVISRKPSGTSPEKQYEKSESLEHADKSVLLIENNSTRRLVAKGLLRSLKINHEVADHFELIPNPSEFDLCLIAAELLDFDGAKAFVGQCKQCIVMGENALNIPSISVPLREKDLVGLIAGPISSKNPEIEKQTTQVDVPTDLQPINFEINLHEVALRLGGSDEIALLVIETFYKDLFNQIASVEDAIEGSNAENIKQVAHLVKGASSTIGAYDLSAFASKVEKLAFRDMEHEGVSEETMEGMCQLLEHLKRFDTVLAEIIAKEELANG